MRKLHRVETGTAALCAVTAAGSIVAFLCGASPHSNLLIAAEATSAIAVATLLASVLGAEFLAWRRSASELALWASSDDPHPADCADCLHQRLEVLDRRLQVDEPHLCSQYGIACTCWSFCASTDASSEGSCTERAIPAAQKPESARRPIPEARCLPLVYRSGMNNCPFRFAPLVAAPATQD